LVHVVERYTTRISNQKNIFFLKDRQREIF